MNLIALTGRLTRDPELKFGQSGKAYAKFSLAVDRTFQKGEVDFINCVAFGKTAELIGEYLRKGNKCGVQGTLQMNRYEKDGEKRTSYDVIVNQVEFLNNKNEEANNAPAPVAPAPEPQHDDSNDDTFPF